MKKFLIATMAALIALMVFVGCAPAKTEEPDKPNDEITKTETETNVEFQKNNAVPDGGEELGLLPRSQWPKAVLELDDVVFNNYGSAATTYYSEEEIYFIFITDDTLSYSYIYSVGLHDAIREMVLEMKVYGGCSVEFSYQTSDGRIYYSNLDGKDVT